MKDLKEILLESVNYFDEIIDLTFNFVDYMYNEGVVAYDDEHLASIVNRKAKPDYMDICQGILSEFKGINKKTKSELENYIKNQSSKQVENAINTGVLNFCDEANI
jgi:hypothetical protein